jgi:hypothetical protein
MDPKKKPLVVGAVAVVAVLALVGYSASRKINQKVGEKVMEKAIEAQTGAKVNIDSNSNGENVTIKTEDGQTQYSAGGSAKLPDGFPQELILADDAKLIMSSTSATGSSVTYLTNLDQTAVFEKYLANIPVLGWKKDMEADLGQGKMLNISKGSEAAVVTIGDNNSKDTSAKTTVSIIWTENKDK